MTQIFVYGTLKRGCKNHHHMAGQAYIGEARTAPGYALFNLGEYPGMVADAKDKAGVTGEIWSVDAKAIKQLDDFEGVPAGMYRRVPVTLLAPFDQPMTVVYTYLYNRDLTGKSALGPTWRE